MKRSIILLLSCYFFVSCERNNSASDKATVKPEQTSSIVSDSAPRDIHKAPAEEIFDYPCAIVLEPTDSQIDSLKKAYSKDEYSSLLDDNLFYVGNARELFENKKLRVIDKKSVGTLRFRKADGSMSEMPVSEFFWGAVLFNGKSDPIEADLTTIEEEYNRYMK